MVLIDSSVRIDFFNGSVNAKTKKLNEIPDFEEAKNVLTSLTVHDLSGKELAIKSVNSFRKLKNIINIRKTADVIIATYCIENNLPLLVTDKDFIPFVKRLKLRSAC